MAPYRNRLLGSALLLGLSVIPPVMAGGAVPLGDALDELQPAAVWQHFHALTRIPRPSHHEDKASALVADFGRRLGLETVVDPVGNVIIRKPASAGMQDRAGVVLQAHLDMVAQRRADAPGDPRRDPVQALLDGGWVRADGTTLGADDGIGVAMIMALLQAGDVAHGPLEALFTVNEEDGFGGATGLAADALRGRLLINIDNEVEGQLLISSAGGVNVEARADYPEEPTPDGMTGLQVSVDGLLGGHSGVDIDKGRASAHQLLARLLHEAPDGLQMRLASLSGGDQRNAIPRQATALLAVPTAQLDAWLAHVERFGRSLGAQLAASDPGVAAHGAGVAVPPRVMAASAQQALLGAVLAAPQGVQSMSQKLPGLVETSGNLGVLSIGDGRFSASVLVRSALDERRDEHAQRFAAVFRAAGATVSLENAYSSWPPNPDSPLVALMQRVYRERFGKEAEVAAIHAGLETSVFGRKYPGMDMVSVGPTIRDVHSPDERLEVASVQQAYELLVATLRQVPPAP